MADEILRSKHAFGSEAGVDQAIADGKIDAYDILFLDEGKIGWIKKDGTKFILEDRDQIVHVSELPAVGDEKTIYIYEGKFYYWNGVEFDSPDTGVDEAVVESKVDEAFASAMAYTDKQMKTAMSEHIAKKYEIADAPLGTLVNYGEREIRIMCPKDSQWNKQNVGAGGDANCYYVTFKTYAPSDDVVGYIEHLGDQVDSEILTDIAVDANGRRYQPTWLAVARYDESTDSWTYYGVSSSSEKYIGWDYQIDWYNADGVMVASDAIRLNLTNEGCHSTIKPYYVSAMPTFEEVDVKLEDTLKTANTYTDEKISLLEQAYTIVEF